MARRSLRLLLLGCLLVLAPVLGARAQKFGYVDSQYILQKLPAYATAQQEVNKLAAAWQKEIEAKRKEIDQLNRDYQLSEPLLLPEQKQKRKDEIAKKEKEAKEFQQKTFGFEGTVFKKRQELMKPVQDQVFEAMEKVAKQKNLAIIFESGDLTMLYTNPTHDYTEYVLEELGIKSPDKNEPGKRPAGSDDQKVRLPGGSGDGQGDKDAAGADSPTSDSPSQPEEKPIPPGKKP